MAPEVGKPPSACSTSRRTNWLWPRQICERRKQKSNTGRTARASLGERAASAANQRTRRASLISRAIDTRMKIDDCWIAHTRPRASWAAKLASESVTPWYAGAPRPASTSAAIQRYTLPSGSESASLTPTYTRRGSYVSPSVTPSVSGRSAQLSWCALRPAPGIATTESVFCCHGGRPSRKRRASSAVDAVIAGCGAASSLALVATTTCSRR